MRAASCLVQPKGGDVCETSEGRTSDQGVWVEPYTGLEVTQKGPARMPVPAEAGQHHPLGMNIITSAWTFKNAVALRRRLSAPPMRHPPWIAY